TAAVDVCRGRARRPARRPVPVADLPRAGHCAARRAGAAAGDPFGPQLDVGLAYLTLDRAGVSLSTGERQRIELTSTVRASTTGMLYVLDEPSVGLHPSNVQGPAKDHLRPFP